jgi:trimethylguanosine synthase
MLDLEASMSSHSVRVRGLPRWLSCRQLLGPGAWRLSAPDAADLLNAEAELARAAAADLDARLRGVGLAGRKLRVEIEPPLPRSAVRQARLAEARRLRAKSPGFSRSGTRLDREARRSLTPEALALALGRRARQAHVIDAGCGAGGNAIGFARAGCRVTAIELDPERLAMARWNARMYAVADRIRFLAGDARELVPKLKADLLFIDAPWGARYDRLRVTLSDLPLLQSLLAERARFVRVWAKVPPSFDPRSIPHAHVSAWFGVGPGDARRIKFLLLELDRDAG